MPEERSMMDVALDHGVGAEEEEETFELVHPDDLEEDDAADQDYSYREDISEEEEEATEETDDEVAEEEIVESSPSEIDELRAEISTLREKLEAGSDAEEVELTPIVGEDEEIDLLTPEGMNVFGNRLIKMAVEQIAPAIAEEASKASSLQAYAQEFYRANPELVDKKAEVQEIGAGIVEKNPGITPEKLFAEVAKAAKKKFNIPAKTVKSKRKPGFTKVGASARTGGGKASRTRTVQDDVLSFIGVSK